MSGRNTLAWAVLGGIAFLFVAGCILRFALFGGLFRGGYGMMGYGMMGFGNGWMGLGMLLFGILVVAGLWLIFGGYRPHHWYVRSDSALEIARERYARGEITQEEFEKIRKSLE